MNNNNTILFDLFPAVSHYNATYKLAGLLKSAGYRIVFAGDESFKQQITSIGFEFYSVPPHIIPLTIVEYKKEGKWGLIINNLSEKFTHKRRKAIEENVLLYDKMIEVLKPNLIILDVHYVYKAVFYYKYGINLIGHESKVLSGRDTYTPPFCCSFVPKRNLFYFLLIKFIWNYYKCKSLFYIFWEGIITFGSDFDSQVRYFAKQNNFLLAEKINYNHYKGEIINYSFKNIHTLLLSAKAFDYPRSFTQREHHIGPLVDFNREKNSVDLRFESVLNEINTIKQQNRNATIVYCSLGTLTALQIKECIHFFRQLSKVCLLRSQLYLIISTGKQFDITHLYPLPQNMRVFQTLPQLTLLRNCDIMITHGGMNSVTECIYAEIPMLVFPLTKLWDQDGNAARVVYHGIGLKGKIRRDSVKKIVKKIDQLILNYSFYKENIIKLKKNILSNDNEKHALEVVKSMIENKIQ